MTQLKYKKEKRMKGTIKARKIAMVDPDTLWERISGNRIPVEFDDGVLEMSSQELILSAYFWLFVSAHGKKVRLVKDMVITNFYKGGMFQKGTARGLFNRVLNYMLEDSGMTQDSEFLYMNLDYILRANDKLYNAIAANCDAYILGLDVVDYIEATDHPSIIPLKEYVRANPNKQAVVDSQAEVERLLAIGLMDENGQELRVSMAAKAGLIKVSQLMQSIFVRGYVHDLNKELLPHPVLDNLVEGMRTPENFALLTRDASVSIAAAKKDLKDVVHKSSKHGYVTTNMRRIVVGDCGSRHYLIMRVRESDMDKIQGRYQILPNGKLEKITMESTHLIGTDIHLRSSIYCTLPNKQHVCSTCYGDTHRNISLKDAIGKAIAREGSRDDIQQPLSMKHVVGDLATGGVIKSLLFQKFFKIKRDGGEYIYLKSQASAVKVILKFDQRDVAGISMITNVDNIDNLPVKRISSVKSVIVHIERKKSSIEERIILSENKTGAVLTYNILSYIRDNMKDLVKNDSEYLSVDITKFVHDRDEPVLKFPDLVATSTDHNNKLVSLYDFSNGKDKNPYGFSNVVFEIYDLINEQRFANLSTVELMVASYLVREKRDGSIDYNICRGWEKGARQIPVNELLGNRSLSASMLYSQQNTSLWNPGRYAESSTSPPLTLDVAMLPKKTVGNPLYEGL